jgi:hypothetical protein
MHSSLSRSCGVRCPSRKYCRVRIAYSAADSIGRVSYSSARVLRSEPPWMANTGLVMDSDLHTGHLPGEVKRFRFANTNPQLKHRAGSTMSRAPGPAERSTCGRCSYTSFSRMPRIREMSCAVYSPSPSIWAILRRMVRLYLPKCVHRSMPATLCERANWLIDRRSGPRASLCQTPLPHRVSGLSTRVHKWQIKWLTQSIEQPYAMKIFHA